MPKAHNPINPTLNTVGVQCGETVLISMRVEDTPQHDNQQSSPRCVGFAIRHLLLSGFVIRFDFIMMFRHDGCEKEGVPKGTLLPIRLYILVGSISICFYALFSIRAEFCLCMNDI